MTAYQIACSELAAEPRTWLITGVAGFIGSHLLETLLALEQRVVGVDDFSTGSPRNLEDVRERVGAEAWKCFDFREGTITDMSVCREACNYADYVLHHAGFVSVPLSNQDPVGCHNANVNGTLNLLIAARDNRVRRFIQASASAVYGAQSMSPVKEDAPVDRARSAYGASKQISETYVRLFFDLYGLETISLRYFNVFGPRQNGIGASAPVIAQWIDKSLRNEKCVINGSGEITRDFLAVANVVQANILTATTRNRKAVGQSYNVASGRAISLAELHQIIARELAEATGATVQPAESGPARENDVPDIVADAHRFREELGFAPDLDFAGALTETIRWYASRSGKR